jgi:hypothetical protein
VNAGFASDAGSCGSLQNANQAKATKRKRSSALGVAVLEKP